MYVCVAWIRCAVDAKRDAHLIREPFAGRSFNPTLNIESTNDCSFNV